MVDFAASRDDLGRARERLDAAQASAAQARQRQRRLAIQLQTLARSVDGDDPVGAAHRERLRGQVREAEHQLAGARSDLASAQERLADAGKGFARFDDPRGNVGRLGDESPFVLFPVRLETRFVTSQHATGPRSHLLVRIYPDDCSIDTFEELLSAAELSNTQRYWQNIWRAGGIEADERAAWRELVTAHGSGRAGYLADTYRPVDVGQRPTKVAASDEILVVVTESPPAVAEATAIAAYWSAVWAAVDDAAVRQAARTTLDGAVGAARAAQLVADYAPANLADRQASPKTTHDVAVSTVFLVLPPDPVTKQAAWSQAPRVRPFPERLVVLGYRAGHPPLQAIGEPVTLPLYLGPDPSADPSSAIHPDGGDLFVPDELRWLVDFDAALAAGMAVSVALTPEQARTGFDRLLVLGVQMAAGPGDGVAVLEELLRQHQRGRSGLSLVPQGTPTHNTTGTGTGYTKLDDADQSFDDRTRLPLFTPTPDAWEKRDGQWVAEALGVDPGLMATVHGSDGRDQMQARAMQRALWPATLGYWMDKMMAPVFGDTTVERSRWFFTRYVRGAGAVPALRMGGQPYGILPTTAFSRIRWLNPGRGAGRVDPELGFLARLHRLLIRLGQDWTTMSGAAAQVGSGADAHQTLLDIIGLHPSSVEYHARYAERIDEMFNVQNLWGAGTQFLQALRALGLSDAAAVLLGELGYAGTQQPDLFQHLFFADASRINTVIDDQPLSETRPVRAYTDDGRNYITWLADAAKASLNAVVAEQGFTGGRTPQALLYLYLRHALMLGYYDTGYRLHGTAGVLDTTALAALKPEPAFVHVADGAAASESRFALLYKPEQRITSSPSMLVSEYITGNLATLAEASDLAEQLDALHVLAAASTGQLERAFAEHVDVCSYRYDAWLLGLVGYQLERMRAANPVGAQSPAGGGTYLGAYAWVEDLRPAAAATRLTPAPVPEDLQAEYGTEPPIRSDPRNGGYIHAPSLPHARTAAVLRSGYLANATPANPQTMAVNLSSDRVRLALATLEGIRNGQSLGALLGYRFERGLHDDHALAEVDKFIYPLRKAFPLVADALSSTRTPPGVPIEAVEARNVLDGRKLVERVRSAGIADYPFGLTTLPPASPAAAAAISAQTNALLDIYDAIADLAMAEGVHQAVQGNFERTGATLEAYTSGHFPPDPEVVQTPPAGIGLTHRVGLHLQPGLTAPPGATPAAQAEPALDAWLGSLLPPLHTIGATVAWTDPVGGTAHALPVTLRDLRVHPIDLLDLVLPDNAAAMTQLDDRMLGYAIATAKPRPDAELHIEYLTAPPGDLSVFEVSALVRSLKTLVSGSRPLRATNVVPHGDARLSQDATVSADRARIAGPKVALDTLRADIAAFLSTLAPLVADPVAQRATILANVDAYVDAATALLERAARFRIPSSGWGFALAWRHNAFTALMADVAALVERWTGRLADFDARITAYDALPGTTPDSSRFGALRTAENLVTTTPGALPAAPALLRTALIGTRTTYVARRDQFVALLSTPVAAYSSVLAALTGLLPVTDVDAAGYDVAPLGDRAVILVQDLSRTLTGHLADIDTRRAATQAQLDAHDTAVSPANAVDALQAAAAALFGPDFRIVPEFAPAPAQANEWANAVAASTGGQLLDHLVNTAGIDEPVDEWIYGVARVRPMLRAWEATTTLVEALRGPAAAPSLLPVQFPYEFGASWVAMQLKPGYVLDSDRLCYTAHYPVPFNRTALQCGLLLDEWTEVIPAPDRTTGITFHFDRPETEPPQSILLVTPASATGRWEWDDLVGALNETLDLAKLRAVEPAQIDGTRYAMFVPATVMAATMYGISIGTSLAAANGVSRYMEENL